MFPETNILAVPFSFGGLTPTVSCNGKLPTSPLGEKYGLGRFCIIKQGRKSEGGTSKPSCLMRNDELDCVVFSIRSFLSKGPSALTFFVSVFLAKPKNEIPFGRTAKSGNTHYVFIFMKTC